MALFMRLSTWVFAHVCDSVSLSLFVFRIFLSFSPSGYFWFFVFPSLCEFAFPSFFFPLSPFSSHLHASSLTVCVCVFPSVSVYVLVCVCVCVPRVCVFTKTALMFQSLFLKLTPFPHPSFAADANPGVWEIQIWGPQVLRKEK